MRTRLAPTPGMLVIEPMPEETRTEAGLYIVGSQETSSYVGTIIAVRVPVNDDPADYFKVGQQVIIGKWAGTTIKIRSGVKTREYLLVNEDSILATLEEEEETDGNPG